MLTNHQTTPAYTYRRDYIGGGLPPALTEHVGDRYLWWDQYAAPTLTEEEQAQILDTFADEFKAVSPLQEPSHNWGKTMADLCRRSAARLRGEPPPNSMAPVNELDLRLPSPLVEIQAEWLTRRQVRLLLKRDDLIHPDLPGNKWRKLKYNLEQARREGAKTLLTFGGAYSNHIRATAAAGHHFGFDTIGIIRGEEHLPLNDVLTHATHHGMRLSYLDRMTYRDKTQPSVINQLRDQFGNFYLVPEGGSNEHAVRGVTELVPEIDTPFDVIACPCGTGGTLAGIAAALRPGQRALGFSALKGGDFLNDDVTALQQATFGHATDNWTIELDHHFGGFAKTNDTLRAYIATFKAEHDITLERIYVAKMMFGLQQLIEHGRFEPDTTIVAVITGTG